MSTNPTWLTMAAALAGCWEFNPNYRAPPDLAPAPDMAGLDTIGCGRDTTGGGGGMGRPEVLVVDLPHCFGRRFSQRLEAMTDAEVQREGEHQQD